MGFFNRRARQEERAITWAMIGLDPAEFQTIAGKIVSSTSVMALSAAWSAVSQVADGISTLPLQAIIKDGRESIPASDPPLWLDTPNGGLTRIDVVNQLVSSLLLHGNAYFLTPQALGQFTALMPLDPGQVTPPQPTARMEPYRVSGEEMKPGELTHIRGLMLPGATEGLSVLKYAKESFGSALATQAFGAAFFGNGAWPGVVVEVPGQLSPVGKKNVNEFFNREHQGADRAHRLLTLTEGAKLNRMTFSPDDAQFLETREFQVADIARFFRVPPELIGGKSTDSLTYSTLEGRNAYLVTVTYLPWIVRIEHALTQVWRGEGGPPDGEIKFNLNGLLRGSVKERYDSYAIGLSNGFLTVDEVRAFEDLPPLPEPPAPNPAPNPAPTDSNIEES